MGKMAADFSLPPQKKTNQVGWRVIISVMKCLCSVVQVPGYFGLLNQTH